jgi:hypothetical protein
MRRQFEERAASVPCHGFGLSVDLYTPDLDELVTAMVQRGLSAGYLEVFKASSAGLSALKHRSPESRFAYHGEGVWVTQPDWQANPTWREELETLAVHAQTLDAPWINIECASKQIAGFQFGTYLPPIYSKNSALVTAANVQVTQEFLDDWFAGIGELAPLFLLEVAPLTYFRCGDLPVPDFFRIITDRVPGGLVLDMGHLWTLYRYTGAWKRQSLEGYTQDFLDALPLERVVELHVAGLAVSSSDDTETDWGQHRSGALPAWIDAHAAPIPPVLFDLLRQVLAHPRLRNLKGVALEVDTKTIPVILDEFAWFSRAFAERWPVQADYQRTAEPRDRAALETGGEPLLLPAHRQARLAEQYRAYAEIVSGRAETGTTEVINADWWCGEIGRYRDQYLPNEILHWGGDLRDMFPETCRLLDRAQVPLEEFVTFWFREPRQPQTPYDFFLLKIERFVEFVGQRAPSASEMVSNEATALKAAYHSANMPAFADSRGLR